MSIELRSAISVKNALESLQNGDYTGETTLKIRLHTPFFSSTLAEEVKEDLINLMGSLPFHLKDLDMRPTADLPHYYAEWKCMLPVEAVTRGIQRGRDLEKITIDTLVLVGGKAKFEKLAGLTKGHPSIKSVVINCESREGTERSPTDQDSGEAISLIDPFVRALGGIDTLETIEFMDGRVSGPSKPSLGEETLAAICALPRLTKLYLLSFSVSDEHLLVMARHLQKKAQLEDLAIECSKLGAAGSGALNDMIRQNQQLKILRLYVHSCQEETTGIDLVEGFAQEVKNANYTSFQLTVPKTCIDGVQERVRKMLRGNYILEKVFLRYYGYKKGNRFSYIRKDNEVDFLLKTNKLGRGKLFQDVEEGDEANTSWMTMLDATDYDLNNIYYLVQSNPLKFAELMEKNRSETQIPDTRSMKKMFQNSRKMFGKAVQGVVCDIQNLMDEQEENLSETLHGIVEKLVVEENRTVIEAVDKKIDSAMETLRREQPRYHNKFRFLLLVCAVLLIMVAKPFDKNARRKDQGAPYDVVPAVQMAQDSTAKRLLTLEALVTGQSDALEEIKQAMVSMKESIKNENKGVMVAVNGVVGDVQKLTEEQLEDISVTLRTVEAQVEEGTKKVIEAVDKKIDVTAQSLQETISWKIEHSRGEENGGARTTVEEDAANADEEEVSQKSGEWAKTLLVKVEDWKTLLS